MDRKNIITDLICKVEYNRSLYKLCFNRKCVDFIPGQHISLGIPGAGSREYSIASGINDDTIDVLIRRIEFGNVSLDLTNLDPGDKVELGFPIGHFSISQNELNSNVPVYLISTGSGLAPFMSISKSFDQFQFNIIHGVKTKEDCLSSEIPNVSCYTLCTSKEFNNDFKGRVTTYLKNILLVPNSLFYLCGNSLMIYEVYNYLTSYNIPRQNIRYEEYF